MSLPFYGSFVCRLTSNLSKSRQSPDMVQTVDARFLCAVCDIEKNPCLYDGKCVKNDCTTQLSRGFDDQCDSTKCDCIGGSAGTLCEKPPLGEFVVS